MKLKVRFASGVLGIALVLMCGSDEILAQTASSLEKTTRDSIQTVPKTYRLTYTITETDGSKRLGTQHFAWTINPDSADSQIKLGSRVPVLTGSYGSDASTARTDVTYLDVGLLISAHLRDFPNGVQIFTRVVQSGVAEEQSTVGKSDPVVRQESLENTALLTPGKPLMLGSLDIPGSTRHLDVEVVVEAVR